MGCVAVCGEHAEERRDECVKTMSVEVFDSHCSEPCLVTEGLLLVPAKRFTPDQQAVSARPAPAPSLPEPSPAASSSVYHTETLKPPEPVFQRLRTLRI